MRKTRTDKQTDRQSDRQSHRQTEADRQTDRQKDRQKHTYCTALNRNCGYQTFQLLMTWLQFKGWLLYGID